MASVGHIAVGLAAARVYTGRMTPRRPSGHAMLFWSALSMLPDADVVGFSLGVRYADEWGHRGATHSLVFAAAVGIVTGLLARRFHAPALRTFIAATLVVASHGLLDTLTDGGLGCALFWPFDQTRYFAPWRPIPVAPIGLGYLSARGLSVAFTELVIFAPLVWFGLVSRRRSELETGGRLH